MKQSNKVMISAIAMATIMSVGFTAYSFAAENPTSGNQEARMPGQFQEVRQAIESGDYATWANLMSDRPNADQFVNEDTFTKLQEAQKLIESGDKEGAKAIFDELGIKGPRGGMHPEMNKNHEAMKAAIESGDYAAWAELMADHPNASEFVNQETFTKLQEAHKLMEAGDKEGAKAIFDELGIKGPRGRMRGEMKRGNFGRFMPKQNHVVNQ